MWTNSNAYWRLKKRFDRLQPSLYDRKNMAPFTQINSYTFRKDKRDSFVEKGAAKLFTFQVCIAFSPGPSRCEPINLSQHVRVLISWAKSWIWNLLCVRVQLWWKRATFSLNNLLWSSLSLSLTAGQSVCFWHLFTFVARCGRTETQWSANEWPGHSPFVRSFLARQTSIFVLRALFLLFACSDEYRWECGADAPPRPQIK